MAAGDKTEAPTPRRRSEARKKGQVAKSPEVNTSLILLVSFWVLQSAGPAAAESYLSLMKHFFNSLGTVQFTISDIHAGILAVGLVMVKILAPLTLSILAVGVVANLGQVGFMFSGEALKIDPKKINPLSGVKRLFALRGVVDLLKSMIKITIVSIVIYNVVRDNIGILLAAPRMSVGVSVAAIVKVAMTSGIRVGVVMLAIAGADFIYQRYEFEKNLKMTKEEIREEMKRYENPQLKSRIRARQRQIAMNRMMSAVPNADVVITNPTHFAVVLKYDNKKMNEPQVVAKGQRLTAQRIKAVAKENNVPMVENRPLARSLFSSVEIGQAIPGDLYQAVAEILAFVYRMKQKAKIW